MKARIASRVTYFPMVQGRRRRRIFQFSWPYWENGAATGSATGGFTSSVTSVE